MSRSLPRSFSVATAAVVAATICVAPSSLSAQQASPLQKSDVVRLLTGSTYTKGEIASIIAGSCLTFSPTSKDLVDFRTLGADDGIIEAIETCDTAASVEITPSRTSLAASVRSSVRIDVRVTRNSRPVSEFALALRGSGRIPGGAAGDLSATTDADGRASFTVPTGTAVAAYRLAIAPAAGDPAAARTVSLSVTAARAASVSLQPGRLALAAGASSATVTAKVTDEFGNPVTGASVGLRAARSGSDALVAAGTTDGAGEVRLRVDATRVGGSRELEVVVDAIVLGALAVTVTAPSPENSAFVAGTEQRAERGAVLPERLVFELRDANGDPVSGAAVAFTVTNGEVDVARGVTDERGRISVAVTIGSEDGPTVVTAAVGSLDKRVVFEPLPEPVAPDTAQARQLAGAADLLASGQYAAAYEAYEAILADDPSQIDALVGSGQSLAAQGREAEAATRFREALRLSPSRRDAQRGLAFALLESGNPGGALTWFEITVRQTPNDVALWVGLARSRAAVGQAMGAKTAYERALQLDPGNRAAERGLAALDLPRLPLLELAFLGGYTTENGRSVGPRMAQAVVWPVPSFRLWFRFDNFLSIDNPAFVRGGDDVEGFYGGAGLEWGEASRYATSLEVGRRNWPPEPTTTQTTWQLEQSAKFRGGRGNVIATVGGYFGHFFDQDDWMAWAKVGVPASRSLLIEPQIYYGNTASTNIRETGRAQEKEGRFVLWAKYGSAGGLQVEPGFGVGSVSSDLSDEFSGTLVEGLLLARAPVARAGHLELFFRYQSVPGTDPFATVALGFDLTLPRSN